LEVHAKDDRPWQTLAKKPTEKMEYSYGHVSVFCFLECPTWDSIPRASRHWSKEREMHAFSRISALNRNFFSPYVAISEIAIEIWKIALLSLFMRIKTPLPLR
jgi:hypothetical protein